ncbi:MAG: diguanylate cyclase [Spirulinaceae cyanobacterium SM2_1_0]|nr:diguanylate cyclase [Spirulinaceae cyanobacterium SM2_1_0]
MQSDKIVAFVERLLGRSLSPVEQWVMQQLCQGQTYGEMARDSSYEPDTLKATGLQLWQELLTITQSAFTQTKFAAILRQFLLQESDALWLEYQQEVAQTELEILAAAAPRAEIAAPGEALPLGSPLYIPRPPLEAIAFTALEQPGCLLRLQAHRKLGKSSLLIRLLAQAERRGYHTVHLDFQAANQDCFDSLKSCWCWFYTSISQQLDLPLTPTDDWDAEVGNKVGSKQYFETHILPYCQRPLVIVFNEINRIFAYPTIARDFLPMLRLWHEQSKQASLWQNLRLVVAYSTASYLTLNLNQSPLNVGLPLNLPPFSLDQAQDLAQRYGLVWASTDVGRQQLQPLLMSVGGNPYLLSIAFDHLRLGRSSLVTLLATVATPASIYSPYLRPQLTALNQRPELRAAMQQVLTEPGITLDAIAAYPLESLGLVERRDNRIYPYCDLYRQYFATQLLAASPAPVPAIADPSRTEVMPKSTLPTLNQSALVANLHQHWAQWQQQQVMLTLLLCKLDYFSLYNEVYGRAAGDRSLQQVATILADYALQSVGLLARYSGDAFALLLPGVDSAKAATVTQVCSKAVEALGIPFEPEEFGGLPATVLTVSIGATAGIPTITATPERLLMAAGQALQTAQRQGGNAVVVTAWSDLSLPTSEGDY